MENYLFQFQQWRLIPYLAAAYALHHFSRSFFANFMELQIGMMMKDTSQRQVRSNFCVFNNAVSIIVCLIYFQQEIIAVG